jgi:hypothetical protein
LEVLVQEVVGQRELAAGRQRCFGGGGGLPQQRRERRGASGLHIS